MTADNVRIFQWVLSVILVLCQCHRANVSVIGCSSFKAVGAGNIIGCHPMSSCQCAPSQRQKQLLFVDQPNLRKLNFSTRSRLPAASGRVGPLLRKTETFVESRCCCCGATSPRAVCCIFLHGKCTPIIVMSGGKGGVGEGRGESLKISLS